MSVSQVRNQVVSGRWRRLLHGVYATHAGALPADGQRWAAVLFGGPEAVVSHTSAAAVYGWPTSPPGRPPDPAVHVTVLPRTRKRSTEFVVIHRAALTAEDIRMHGDLAVTSPERTVVDLLRLATNVDDALALVGRAVQSRRTTAARLAAALRTPTVKWRAAVLDALDDVAAGSHSRLELAFVKLLRAHRLPVGTRQARFSDGGRPMFVDMAYERVIIELDGRLGHDSAYGVWRDMERDNAASVAGLATLRFGWADVRRRPCAVARQVGAMIGREPKDCRRCRAKAR